MYYDLLKNKIYFFQPSATVVDPPTPKDYYLSVIEHPDSLGPICRVKFNGLYLNGRRAPGGFGPTVNYNLGALGQAYPWPANDLKDSPPPICAGDSVRLGEWFSEPGTTTVTVTVLPPDASPCRTTRRDETTAQIRIYPNPTTGPLTVELPAGIRTDIDLLNAIGEGLLRVVNRSGTVHLDLTPYPDGH
jgi:hypothetical protein